MTETATDDGRQTAGEGSYQLAPWNADGAAELSVTAAGPEALLLAGLQGVIAAARGDRAPTTAAEDEASAAAPIRGQGGDLAAVFAELAADLLAQLDANGPGLDHVRLDGLLTTDDGGYTAWGYAVGAAAENPPPIGLVLDGDPVVVGREGSFALSCTLRRG